MHFKSRLSCSAIIGLLIAATSGSEASGACSILNPERGAQQVRYFMASHSCAFFKKPLDYIELFTLLEGSQSISGIVDAMGQGVSPKERLACFDLIQVFIEKQAIRFGGKVNGNFPRWNIEPVANSTSFCRSVKQDIEDSLPLKNLFTKFGAL
jgi:hypothetical protein